MILTGDSLSVLPSLGDGSVHMCVTSPPYWGLRDYGVEGQIGMEKTPEEFIEKMVAVFREVRRVLREDGTFWLNIGDSYGGAGGAGANAIVANTKANVQSRCDSRGIVRTKDLCLIPWRLALALQNDGWWVRSIIAWCKKCLSGGTMLYARTQKGDMPCMLKDLVRLDPRTVKLWDGEKWTQVLGWSKTLPDRDARATRGRRRQSKHRGKESAPIAELEIELRSGERIGCTPNHRWPTKRGELFAADLVVGDTLLQAKLPEPEQPDSPAMLPDDDIGWLCGFYLAEGCCFEKGISFSIHADETEYAERIKRIANAFGGTATFGSWRGKSGLVRVYSKTLAEICRNYIAGRDCYNKHIDNACWQRSNRFLAALLQGYLDGDGHRRTDTDEWRLGFCKNDSLASDLRTLAARLGVSLRLKRTSHVCKGKKYPGWRGSLRFGNDRIHDDSQIVAIRQSRARVYWDIAVADKPNWFCLASGIVSHNSPMPESVTDRPTSSWEPIFLLAKSARYYYDAEAVKEKSNFGPGCGWDPRQRGDFGGKTEAIEGRNAFRAINESRNLRNSWDIRYSIDDAEAMLAIMNSGVGEGDLWRLGPEPFEGSHFAVFPTEIPRRAILTGTSEKGCCPKCLAPWERITSREKVKRERPNDYTKREGANGTGNSCANDVAGVTVKTIGWEPGCDCNAGEPIPCTVLEPFLGSGTTLQVARSLGRNGIGIELNPEYVKLAEKRIKRPCKWEPGYDAPKAVKPSPGQRNLFGE